MRYALYAVVALILPPLASEAGDPVGDENTYNASNYIPAIAETDQLPTNI